VLRSVTTATTNSVAIIEWIHVGRPLTDGSELKREDVRLGLTRKTVERIEERLSDEREEEREEKRDGRKKGGREEEEKEGGEETESRKGGRGE